MSTSFDQSINRSTVESAGKAKWRRIESSRASLRSALF
jgi:hypothetical protein